MSKVEKYVLLPIDEKKNGAMKSIEIVKKFAKAMDLTLVAIKEPKMTEYYWNTAMKAYLKRPRGYLRTHAVYVGIAKNLVAAKLAATAWHSYLQHDYVMKPLSAALVSMVLDRIEADEEKPND